MAKVPINWLYFRFPLHPPTWPTFSVSALRLPSILGANRLASEGAARLQSSFEAPRSCYRDSLTPGSVKKKRRYDIFLGG